MQVIVSVNQFELYKLTKHFDLSLVLDDRNLQNIQVSRTTSNEQHANVSGCFEFLQSNKKFLLTLERESITTVVLQLEVCKSIYFSV